MNKEHVTTSEEVNTLERTAERFADQYASKDDDPIFWKMTTAEEIAERKSNGEIFLIYIHDQWACFQTKHECGTTFSKCPFDSYAQDVRAWSGYKILGPLRPEVL